MDTDKVIEMQSVTNPTRNRPARILILGGTSEASELAAHLAARADLTVISSLAGRVSQPRLPAGIVRVGGFAGVTGLISYLVDENIAAVIDATHPFAAQMSAHAVAACAATALPLLALERPPWQRAPGDHWIEVDDLPAAAEALGAVPRRVFLGIGRLHLKAFAAHSQHTYLVRLVDPPRAPLPLRDAEVIVARGPFDRDGDRAMLTKFRTDIVVAKNAGGDSGSAKIEAARELALPVVMICRPFVPARQTVDTVAEVLRWLGHDTPPAERGV